MMKKLLAFLLALMLLTLCACSNASSSAQADDTAALTPDRALGRCLFPAGGRGLALALGRRFLLCCGHIVHPSYCRNVSTSVTAPAAQQ